MKSKIELTKIPSRFAHESAHPYPTPDIDSRFRGNDDEWGSSENKN